MAEGVGKNFKQIQVCICYVDCCCCLWAGWRYGKFFISLKQHVLWLILFQHVAEGTGNKLWSRNNMLTLFFFNRVATGRRYGKKIVSTIQYMLYKPALFLFSLFCTLVLEFYLRSRVTLVSRGYTQVSWYLCECTCKSFLVFYFCLFLLFIRYNGSLLSR